MSDSRGHDNDGVDPRPAPNPVPGIPQGLKVSRCDDPTPHASHTWTPKPEVIHRKRICYGLAKWEVAMRNMSEQADGRGGEPSSKRGCYICQPNNPNAAEEGCKDCDREFWSSVVAKHGALTVGECDNTEPHGWHVWTPKPQVIHSPKRCPGRVIGPHWVDYRDGSGA